MTVHARGRDETLEKSIVTELKKILYVEDQSDIQLVAQLALESIGHFDVEICSSGEQALARIAEFSPDLVLLDVMMPGMDGPATLQAIRAREDSRQLPVIFMTARILPDEVRDLKALGALDVIAKPFDPVTLGDDIRNIWYRYQASD